jgi:hypothetical protein
MSIPQLLSALTNGQQITLADGRVVTVSKSGGKAIAVVSGYPTVAPPLGFSFIPNSAFLGGSVTLTATGGANFTGATSVTIGGTAQPSYVITNASSLTINNIAGSSGVIQVVAPNGTYFSSTALAIIAEPATGGDALLRLRSSDVVLSGVFVTTMTNSGSGGQTVTSPSGSRPNRVISGQNGRQTIDCDPSDYMVISSEIALGADFTIMVASRTDAAAYYGGHGTLNRQLVDTGTNLQVFDGTSTITSPQPLTTFLGAWSVKTWVYSGGSYQFYENLNSLGAAAGGPLTLNQIGRIVGPITLFDLQMGDFYIWGTALSMSARVAMVEFLKAKWAIA